MVVIYHIGIVFTATFILWLLLSALFYRLFRERINAISSSALALVVIVAASFASFGLLFLLLNFSNTALQTVQTQIAKPYIETSLQDANCDMSEGSVFYGESKLKWQSVDERAECYYDNVDWVCTCLP